MPPTFTHITPSLPVTSIPSAITYYTTALSFHLAGRDADNHCWLQLGTPTTPPSPSAGVNIYLRKRGFPAIENDVQNGKVYISLQGEKDELERLHEEFVGKGALVKGGVSVKPWGLKDVVVEDHDGNVIVFNQRVEGWTMPAKTIMTGKESE